MHSAEGSAMAERRRALAQKVACSGVQAPYAVSFLALPNIHCGFKVYC